MKPEQVHALNARTILIAQVTTQPTAESMIEVSTSGRFEEALALSASLLFVQALAVAVSTGGDRRRPGSQEVVEAAKVAFYREMESFLDCTKSDVGFDAESAEEGGQS